MECTQEVLWQTTNACVSLKNVGLLMHFPPCTCKSDGGNLSDHHQKFLIAPPRGVCSACSWMTEVLGDVGCWAQMSSRILRYVMFPSFGMLWNVQKKHCHKEEMTFISLENVGLPMHLPPYTCRSDGGFRRIQPSRFPGFTSQHT